MDIPIDSRTEWSLPRALAQQAAAQPDRVWLTVLDEGELTFSEAARQADAMAAHVASRGVRPGDVVCLFMSSGMAFVQAWLGITRLGAVVAPLNPALRGSLLAHQLEVSGARWAVVADDLRSDLEAGAARAGADLQVLDLTGWSDAGSCSDPLPEGQDLGCLMFTSGTTGPSKCVEMPHAHCYLFGVGTIRALGLTADDRYYTCMPLHHANGLFMQLGATLIAGATVALRPHFSASAWLSDIREHECTITNTLGAMTQYVIARPPAADDRDHQLRVVCPVPNPPAHDEALRQRFGVPEVVSAYGMTEVNIPLYGRLGEPRPGSAGRVLEEFFEVSIRHPRTDEECAPGELGEIMVRPLIPFGFMSGYTAMPVETVATWRNFWFHTGDSGTMDAEGWVTFADRTKDCIRRRGENISSYEIEREVITHPDVWEVAAYAVPADGEGTEDEVMLSVVTAPGSPVSAADVAAHADQVLPRYARPRYVRIVEALPKTPTAKVRKQQLRDEGVTPDVWDRGARS